MKLPSNDFSEINSHYLRLIREQPMLTLDEEYALAKQWRENGDAKAIEKLVASHLRLVTKVAGGYRGYGLPISDLISEGNVGIMQAMRHYDPEKGFRLSTYAIWWIKAAIQEYILHTWSLVKIGTTSAQKKLFFNLRREKIGIHHGQLTQEKVADIAQKLGVKEAEVWQMNERLASQDHSLNSTIRTGGEGESEWMEWLVDESDNQEVTLAHHDELNKRRDLLNQAMETLSARERQIIVERRLSEVPQTLDALSVKLGISRERVRQIEVKVFEKLQKTMKRLSKGKYEYF